MKTFLAAVASTAGILTLAQPASAVIYDWQFTNEDGNFGNSTDVVAGFVEFDATSYSDLANRQQEPAINLQITSVTGLSATSSPFFGDGGIELNTNLVSGAFRNEFGFDGAGEVSGFSFGRNVDNRGFGGSGLENFRIWEVGFMDSGSFLINFGDEFGEIDARITDNNSSSTQFTQQASASVPFEFSPTLGLFLVGGMFAGRSYVKRRNSLIK